ncbi:MAG: tetratricopeptide repeat protein [Burkholderiaceae bacterium]|nr:MAG: tetratricopeptide repeat protein [Burkholderiaceae bacterium]
MNTNIATLIQNGIAHHQAQRLQQAQDCYQQALQLDPQHPDALHLLGVIAHQIGRNDLAIDLIGQAINRHATAQMYSNRALALQALGRLDEAAASLRQAIALQPEFAEAHNILGNVLKALGQNDAARASYTQALALQPSHAQAHYNLGKMLQAEGQLDAAAACYRQALAAWPDYADAHNNLGNVLRAQGNTPAALESYRRAITAQPNAHEAHANLGLALFDQKDARAAVTHFCQSLTLKPDQTDVWVHLALAYESLHEPEGVIDSYRHALQLQPDLAEAHCNLGNALKGQGQLDEAADHYRTALSYKPTLTAAHYNLGNVLQAQGHLDEAVTCYRRALEQQPDYVETHNNLGLALHAQRKFDDAIASYRRALALNPQYVEAGNNLGVTLQAQGHLEEAEAAFRRVLEIRPDYADAHNNLGLALRAQEKFPAAIASYHRALELQPEYVEVYNNLGLALQAQGKFVQAVGQYQQALALRPDYLDAHNNLGLTLETQGKPEAALAEYQKALAIKPDSAEAHSNLGNVYLGQGRAFDALGHYRRALELNPDLPQAHNNLGNALKDQGHLDEAIACYQRALELKPDYDGAHSNLLFCLNYHAQMPAEEIFAAYRHWDEVHTAHLPRYTRYDNARDPNKRLRIAYVSPDFRKHSARHCMEPILARHDKTQVEVFAYAEVLIEDEVSARFKQHADHWINTVGMTDVELAERIRADGIDIAVDMAGHTVGNRLRVLARKPTPIQASHWVGYGCTSGVAAIDYFIADAHLCPPGMEHLFAETPLRLPHLTAYRPAENMGEPGPLPALQNGHITFGALTRSVRINARVIAAWAKILAAVPNSRLMLNSGNFRDPQMQDHLRQQFVALGIAAERLELGFESPPWNVLRKIDITLDCFPHNSGTTLFESIYMGLPFITLAGRPAVGRIGSSIVAMAGHPEWIVHSEAEYIEKNIALASDIDALANLRSTLRAQLQAGPLFDEAGYVRALEAAYRTIWQQWCARCTTPQAVDVAS